MTKEEFAQKMSEIYNDGVFDNEGAHGKADGVMYKALKDLGYDFTDYDRMADDFWYA